MKTLSGFAEPQCVFTYPMGPARPYLALWRALGGCAQLAENETFCLLRLVPEAVEKVAASDSCFMSCSERFGDATSSGFSVSSLKFSSKITENPTLLCSFTSHGWTKKSIYRQQLGSSGRFGSLVSVKAGCLTSLSLRPCTFQINFRSNLLSFSKSALYCCLQGKYSGLLIISHAILQLSKSIRFWESKKLAQRIP